ncbi:uncharacterized protein LOC134241188, partial [Saccostrea cucullata]|uniref:uncharacterized protein LOC134241188 n=1 Tax=Saccostrea cuccullata TaxID=36930 RepID=UPI002ED46516
SYEEIREQNCNLTNISKIEDIIRNPEFENHGMITIPLSVGITAVAFFLGFLIGIFVGNKCKISDKRPGSSDKKDNYAYEGELQCQPRFYQEMRPTSVDSAGNLDNSYDEIPEIENLPIVDLRPPPLQTRL